MIYKKVVSVGIIALILLFLSGCVTSSNYIIRVTGDPGVAFSGSYLVMSNGQSISQTVDGVAYSTNEPTEYSVTGNRVSVAFQKKSERRTLIVEILKNNKVVASSSTQAAYGVVSVATS